MDDEIGLESAHRLATVAGAFPSGYGATQNACGKQEIIGIAFVLYVLWPRVRHEFYLPLSPHGNHWFYHA